MDTDEPAEGADTMKTFNRSQFLSSPTPRGRIIIGM